MSQEYSMPLNVPPSAEDAGSVSKDYQAQYNSGVTGNAPADIMNEDPNQYFPDLQNTDASDFIQDEEPPSVEYQEEPPEDDSSEQAQEMQAEEQQYESPVHKRTHRDSLKGRLNQVLREKYQYQSALEEVRQENERLKQLNQVTADAAMKSYDEAVQNDVSSAKRALDEAIESGDATAQSEAQFNLNVATNRYLEAENWKSRNAINQQQQQQMQNPYAQQNFQNTLQVQYAMDQYLNDRDFLHPDSEQYNPELSQKVAQYSRHIEQLAAQNGAAHEIGNASYFKAIDAFIMQEMQGQKSHEGRGQLNMRQSRQSVAPVRSSYSTNPGVPSTRGKQSVTLSPQEKSWAREIGVTEAQYAQHILSENRKTKLKK